MPLSPALQVLIVSQVAKPLLALGYVQSVSSVLQRVSFHNLHKQVLSREILVRWSLLSVLQEHFSFKTSLVPAWAVLVATNAHKEALSSLQSAPSGIIDLSLSQTFAVSAQRVPLRMNEAQKIFLNAKSAQLGEFATSKEFLMSLIQHLALTGTFATLAQVRRTRFLVPKATSAHRKQLMLPCTTTPVIKDFTALRALGTPPRLKIIVPRHTSAHPAQANTNTRLTTQTTLTGVLMRLLDVLVVRATIKPTPKTQS